MIIITTVGTSFLTNILKKNYNKYFNIDVDDTLSEKIKNGTASKDELKNINFGTLISGEINSKYSSNKKALETVLFDDNCTGINLNASAEIKSICKIADDNPATVYLLTTDTFMSEFAAEKIKEAFNSRSDLQITVEEVKRIKGLSIEDVDEFQTNGLDNLMKELDNIYKKKTKQELILNISGGYKALIPFLTIYAQLKDLKLAYIYENSEKVIKINSLPIDFDWAFIESIGSLLTDDAIKKVLSNLENNEKLIKLLNRYGLINEENKSLSTIGTMLHKYIFEKKSPLANTILGSYVELKYYHLFNENYLELPYSQPELSFEPNVLYKYNGNEIDIVSNSKEKNGYKKIGDIDLVLRNKDGSLVFCEIKSEREFIKYNVEKAKARLDYQKKKGNVEIPVEYLFIIWKSKIFIDDSSQINSKVTDKLLELCDELNIEINAYVHELKLKNSIEQINYGSLLREKIKDEDFKNIDFKCNNKN